MSQWVEPGWPRERHLTENLEHVIERERPDAKVILWLHNSHVAVENPADAEPRMGWRLRERCGRAYWCMALEFGHGTIQTRGITEVAHRFAEHVGESCGQLVAGGVVTGNADRFADEACRTTRPPRLTPAPPSTATQPPGPPRASGRRTRKWRSIDRCMAGFTDVDDNGHVDMLFVDPDFAQAQVRTSAEVSSSVLATMRRRRHRDR
jgi:hypothetical protein